MEMQDLAIPSLNRFASDYLSERLETEDYFHYNLSDDGMYQNRYKELMSRRFPRAKLANYIEQYMERFPKSGAVKKNIEAFRNEHTVVVIGGQQAGLLTGPLYTIHKVISIVKLAEEQSKALNKTVIPVFWIAGEDHDLAEVNHVYTLKQGKPEKKAYPLYHPFKTMVTDIELDSDIAQEWVEEIFETYGETNFTSKLLEDIKEIIQESKTFVDFFSALIHRWFSDYGLLLVDAGDPNLRKIESEYLVSLIEKTESITEAVLAQQSYMKKQNYNRMIDMSDTAANLFYYDSKHNERILLDTADGAFFGKSEGISFSKEELLDIAHNTPERLSNNVVTRPIMQELLFPVLAFISGPGEIAYWAELKRAFELFSIKMPPIVPRLNISLIERGIQTDINETELDISTIITKGVKAAENEFLQSVKDTTIDTLFEQTKRELIEKHQLITERALMVDKGLEPMLEKNLAFLEHQLDFMSGKIDASMKRKHEVTLKKYERIELSLYPLQGPQERTWNVFYYVNKYGPDFIKELMELPYTFNNHHKIIYL